MFCIKHLAEIGLGLFRIVVDCIMCSVNMTWHNAKFVQAVLLVTRFWHSQTEVQFISSVQSVSPPQCRLDFWELIKLTSLIQLVLSEGKRSRYTFILFMFIANLLLDAVSLLGLQLHFYPRNAMLARVIAIATCLSVRPSVCLSRACIAPKRRKLASWFLHRLVAPWF